MAALTDSTAVATSASGETGALHGWRRIDPLPDRIGFGGMFAGVLGGRLVAGGGSQFPEKPLWLKGTKAFTDRIFTLSALDAKWIEHPTRLPVPMGSFASATTAEAIYLIGGLNDAGCLRQVWEIRADEDGLAFNVLPDLPNPIGYGAAAVVGRRLYVFGGLVAPASKTPAVDMWSLDLEVAKGGSNWRREPDLPGEGVFVAAAASDGKLLYALGGIGFDAAGKPIPSPGAFRFDPVSARWERLPDLPEPRVGISSPCPVVPGNKLFLVGGYAEVFPGAPREHPGFSAQTLYLNLADTRWENGPLLPNAPAIDRDSPGDAGPAPMIGAPGVVWKDCFVVVGGEVRASVRTPGVLAWPLRTDRFV